MPEYKYLGLSLAGRPIQGILYASNWWELKKKLKEIAQEHRININRIQKKSTFQYKVRKGMDKPVTGEQTAFSQEEVQRALFNMGFQVISIRKRLIDLKKRVPRQDIVIFIDAESRLPLQITGQVPGAGSVDLKLNKARVWRGCRERGQAHEESKTPQKRFHQGLGLQDERQNFRFRPSYLQAGGG